MWGQARALCSALLARRIIPTRVGTRSKATESLPLSEDHPHACGDKNSRLLLTFQRTGSSPRVWGQVMTTHHFILIFRIIPTRVGTSTLGKKSRKRIKDHPHACGDKLRSEEVRQSFLGSSPRVWGQVFFSVGFARVSRIIPTRVGTSDTS